MVSYSTSLPRVNDVTLLRFDNGIAKVPETQAGDVIGHRPVIQRLACHL